VTLKYILTLNGKITMEERKFRDLFNTEEWILHNLKNAKYQVKFYLQEIEKASEKQPSEQDQKVLLWYRSVFEYYRDDLIPALLESADMEERHLDVLTKNPDPKFEPLRSEVEYHQELNKKFFIRFEEIHREFHGFIHGL
jgi:hypothetical protein